jgi:hypothetical protein
MSNVVCIASCEPLDPARHAQVDFNNGKPVMRNPYPVGSKDSYLYNKEITRLFNLNVFGIKV